MTKAVALKLMIEAGAIQTTYSAYKTPMELCKIGTYQDYIYKDGDKWYKHAEIGKATYDGSEASWVKGSDSSNIFIVEQDDMANPMYASMCRCDHFTWNIEIYGHDIVGFLASKKNNNVMAFRFGMGTSADYNTLTKWTTWLSTHNIAVYYALATPTDTEITDSELVGQLDALLEGSLYKGLNNVFLIPSAGADGTMTMEYRIIYEKETIVQDTTPVKLDLTDGGIINACLCRQNVQVIMRETKDSSES